MSLPKRQRIRLKAYDYSAPGYYFVTICTHEKRHYFGCVQDGSVCYSELGEIADAELRSVEVHRPNVRVNRFVVMPNHVHVVFEVVGRAMTCHGRDAAVSRSNQFSKPVSGSLPSIVGAYKAAVTRRAGETAAMTSHGPTGVWQAGYYEHVIRHEKEYLEICRYIDENPLKWADDEYCT